MLYWRCNASPPHTAGHFAVTLKTPDGDLHITCPPDTYLLDHVDDLEDVVLIKIHRLLNRAMPPAIVILAIRLVLEAPWSIMKAEQMHAATSVSHRDGDPQLDWSSGVIKSS